MGWRVADWQLPGGNHALLVFHTTPVPLAGWTWHPRSPIAPRCQGGCDSAPIPA